MNARSTILIFCFFILNRFLSIGQTHSIDSLKEKVSVETNERKKLEALISLGEYHHSINKDSLYRYALSAKTLASKVGTEKTKSLAEIIFINALLRHGKTDSAFALVEACLLENPVSDPATRDIYFKLAALKADCFGDASNYKDALSELYRIISEAEQYKDSLVLAKNISTVGVINYNLDHVPEAFNWYFKGLLFITDDPRFYSVAAVLYINLAETYRWVQQIDSATFYIDKAISLCKKNENLFFLANALRVKANIYKEKKEYSRAEETMLECIAIREKSEGKLLLSNEQLAVANIYTRSGNIDKAIKILNDALISSALKPDNSVPQANTGYEVDALKISYYNSLAQCYRLKGDSKKYEETLEKIIAAKDAFYQANSARSIAELQTKFEVQKKERTIAEQKLNLTIKNYWLFGSAIFAAMATLIIWLAFKNYRRKQNIKMQLALQEEKRMAAQSIIDAEEHERKRIAADLHDNIGAYATAIRADVEKITDNGFEKSNASLQNLQQHSQEIINSLRDTIWVLNKDNITITGISDRIKNYISKLRPTYTNIQFHILEEINNDIRISSQNALNIFRIVQEALHNALKHSNAASITVYIGSNETFRIKISDDGKGMPENNTANGNGLRNMQARAREIDMQLSIASGINGGTELLLTNTTIN